ILGRASYSGGADSTWRRRCRRCAPKGRRYRHPNSGRAQIEHRLHAAEAAPVPRKRASSSGRPAPGAIVLVSVSPAEPLSLLIGIFAPLIALVAGGVWLRCV